MGLATGLEHMAERMRQAHCDGVDYEHFLDAVIDGLSRQQKCLPTAYLYDARGSALFEEITTLDEYYQTRAEIEILERYVQQWAASLASDTVLVEFGSGSSVKTEILLSASSAITAYAPIDVSAAALDFAEQRLALRFPELRVLPIVGDFRSVKLPSEFNNRPLTGFFPGSTIGNLTPLDAQNLLRSLADLLAGGSSLLIGIDLRKDTDRLLAAYDDARGVTAAFNLNLLKRINSELGADFDLHEFRHLAKYDAQSNRIEMHLVSQKAQNISIKGQIFSFAEGETIHTENSYKYTIDDFRELAKQAGWQPRLVWTDAEQLFSVHMLVCD